MASMYSRTKTERAYADLHPWTAVNWQRRRRRQAASGSTRCAQAGGRQAAAEVAASSVGARATAVARARRRPRRRGTTAEARRTRRRRRLFLLGREGGRGWRPTFASSKANFCSQTGPTIQFLCNILATIANVL